MYEVAREGMPSAKYIRTSKLGSWVLGLWSCVFPGCGLGFEAWVRTERHHLNPQRHTVALRLRLSHPETQRTRDHQLTPPTRPL